jgi:hypothetical protein
MLYRPYYRKVVNKKYIYSILFVRNGPVTHPRGYCRARAARAHGEAGRQFSVDSVCTAVGSGPESDRTARSFGFRVACRLPRLSPKFPAVELEAHGGFRRGGIFNRWGPVMSLKKILEICQNDMDRNRLMTPMVASLKHQAVSHNII